MSQLSILIPRCGTTAAFENTLASVLRYRLPRHQVIVAQAEDDVDEWGLGSEVTFANVTGPATTASALDAVLPLATGDVIHVLLPGMEVFEHWFAESMRRLTGTSVGVVAPPVSTGRGSEIVRGFSINAAYVPRLVREAGRVIAGPTAAAAFFRRSVLDALAPLHDTLDDPWCGLDLALAAKRLGWRCEAADGKALILSERSLRYTTGGFGTGQVACRLRTRHHNEAAGILQHLGVGWFWARTAMHPAAWAEWLGYRAGRRWVDQDDTFFHRVKTAIDDSASHLRASLETGEESASPIKSSVAA